MRGSERYARHERCVVENGCDRGCTSRLRHERLTRGYGLRELARMLCINETHLSRAERRKEGLSDRRKLQVARFFGLSVDDLFFSEPAEQADHAGATAPAPAAVR